MMVSNVWLSCFDTKQTLWKRKHLPCCNVAHSKRQQSAPDAIFDVDSELKPPPRRDTMTGGGAGAQKAASGNSASKDFLKRVKDFVGSTAYDSFSKLLKPFKETATVARKLAAVQKKALKKELAAIDARAAAAPGGAGAPSASAAAERARLVRDIKAISTHRDARRDGIFRELLESICAIFFAPRDEANDVGAAPASSRGARRGEIVASFKKFVPRAYHTLYSEVVAALERRAEGASS